MLATIILDAFQKDECRSIADALDVICSPDDTYGFASACVYAFWSVPERELLYIGLARNISHRFQQHTRLITCEPNSCKSKEIETYFINHDLLGYSILVQSSLSQPPSPREKKRFTQEFGDAFCSDLAMILDGEENIKLGEGFLLAIHKELGDTVPPWNKIGGSRIGGRQMCLSDFRQKMDLIAGIEAGKEIEDIEREQAAKGPDFQLLLNLDGSELSDLNAMATLREIANNATFYGHECFLHGARMSVVSLGISFSDALQMQVKHNSLAISRLDEMERDGYLNRRLCVPGLPPVTRPNNSC